MSGTPNLGSKFYGHVICEPEAVRNRPPGGIISLRVSGILGTGFLALALIPPGDPLAD